MCVEIGLNMYFVSPPKCFVNKAFLSISHLAEEVEMGACFNFYIKLCWPTFTELTDSCIHPTKASNLKRDYKKQTMKIKLCWTTFAELTDSCLHPTQHGILSSKQFVDTLQ